MGLIDKTTGTAGVATAGAVGLGTAYYIGEAETPGEVLQWGTIPAIATFGLGYTAYKNKRAIGSAALSVAEWTGGKTLKVGEYVGGKVADDAVKIGETAKTFGKNLWEGKYDQSIKNTAENIAAKGEKWADRYVKIEANNEGKILPKVSLKGKAKGIIGAITLAGTLKAMAGEAESRDVGVIDPYIAGPAPRLPSYADNAGATGDLVFALHKNARAF